MKYQSATKDSRFSTMNKTNAEFFSGHLSIENAQIKSLQQAKSIAVTGKVKMSDRETEWYLTDKRLIFACNKFEDFALWVGKL